MHHPSGTLIGFSSGYAAMKECDTLLLLGTNFPYRQFYPEHARIVQIEKRGTVLGDRTAGAVMTSRIFPHRAGLAAVAFYAASITVGDVRLSDGTSLEKVGVRPDEIVLPSPADLAAGRDPVLA